MAAANPWDPASAPNGAGLVLGHFIASGMVNQVRGGGCGVIKGMPTMATEYGCELVLLAVGVVRVLVGVCTIVIDPLPGNSRNRSAVAAWKTGI